MTEYITIDEFTERVRTKEKDMDEAFATTQMIQQTSIEVMSAAASGKVRILTDYDADGICSGYIMYRTIKALNSRCDVEVECNDRRGSYGLSPDIQGNPECQYIVLDMGSNQLPLARERLGENVIIIDHHPIEDERISNAFKSQNATLHNTCLCNPHAINIDDSQNAQYCATGLCYRIYEEAKNISKTQNLYFRTNRKQENSISIMAGIGTISDVVALMYANSNNRAIVKKAMQLINNADENNIDQNIGYLLTDAGIGLKDVTAKNVAFKVGAYLNAASRMSEVINVNGAQKMLNALLVDNIDSRWELDELKDINTARKSMLLKLRGKDYYNTIEDYRFGEHKDSNVVVYCLPLGTPSAFCGVIAGFIEEAVDKPAYVLAPKKDSDGNTFYTGSARNADGYISLTEFMDKINGQGFDCKYGGHRDAMGISRLDNFPAFMSAVISADSEAKLPFKDKPVERLILSPIEFKSGVLKDKLLQLEPIGQGLELPNIEIEDKIVSSSIKAKNPNWRTQTMQSGLNITDWSYSDNSYTQGSDGMTKILCRIELNDYGGLHPELTVDYKRDFISENERNLSKSNDKTQTQLRTSV